VLRCPNESPSLLLLAALVVVVSVTVDPLARGKVANALAASLFVKDADPFLEGLALHLAEPLAGVGDQSIDWAEIDGGDRTGQGGQGATEIVGQVITSAAQNAGVVSFEGFVAPDSAKREIAGARATNATNRSGFGGRTFGKKVEWQGRVRPMRRMSRIRRIKSGKNAKRRVCGRRERHDERQMRRVTRGSARGALTL